jgi:hypothetical protein
MKSSNHQTSFRNQNPIEEEEEMYIMTLWYMEAKGRKEGRKREREKVSK